MKGKKEYHSPSQAKKARHLMIQTPPVIWGGHNLKKKKKKKKELKNQQDKTDR
jgi:hypothetical protein